VAKVLPFARKRTAAASLDVCLAKGGQRRHYVIAELRPDVWECSIDEDGLVSRVELSQPDAVRRRAELELRIATDLGAGWTLERNR
jgi:hypothetical protein